MGLFSFSNKNKQESAAEDSSYHSRAEEDSAAVARARAKRASSADEPAAARGRQDKAAVDPVLPEKKRARRRLVGAIALALAVAVGLPMLLDAEPKPLASDIAIQIPSKDKAPPPPPAAALDKQEEIIEPPMAAAKAQLAAAAVAPPAAVALPAAVAPPTSAPSKADAGKAEAHPPARSEARPEPKAEARSEPKAEAKSEARSEARQVAKVAVKADEKPAAAKPAGTAHDADRALAILEGKAADKAGDKGGDKAGDKAADAGQKFVLQVAALATQDKVNELQGKLKEAGIASFTRKVPTQAGELIRVQIGPLGRDDAEKMRAKLGKLGLAGRMMPI